MALVRIRGRCSIDLGPTNRSFGEAEEKARVEIVDGGYDMTSFIEIDFCNRYIIGWGHERTVFFALRLCSMEKGGQYNSSEAVGWSRTEKGGQYNSDGLLGGGGQELGSLKSLAFSIE